MADISPEYFTDMLDGVRIAGVDTSRLTPMEPRIEGIPRSYRVNHNANMMETLTAVLQRNGESRSIGHDVARYAVRADEMDRRRTGYDFEYRVNGFNRRPEGNHWYSQLWSRIAGNYHDDVDSTAFLVRGNSRRRITLP